MARWPENRPRTSFSDMPAHLQAVDLNSPDSVKEARARWLEEHGLSFVDFCAWRRAQDPRARLRPPSRRKLMTAEQLAALDDALERTGGPQW
jgi:hypothetical protein